MGTNLYKVTHGDFIELLPLRNKASSTTTLHPTQSHYPDTVPTSSCHILIKPCALLGSDKYKCLSHWFDVDQGLSPLVQIPWFPKTGDGA